MERRHVVLVTYGEPPSPAFGDQLAYSWRILLGLTRKVDAIPRPLLPVIALARAWGRRRTWRAYGYESPLESITEGQARGLEGLLAEAAPDAGWRVHVAYEYRRPLVTDVLARIPADELVSVMPLYAADSAFTHALSREAVEGVARPVDVLGALAPEVLGRVSAAHVLAHTADGWQGPDMALVLVAHGTVLDPPKPIDTGREATERLCEAVTRELAGHFGLVVNGWLNHTRGGRWTEPPIDRALAHVTDAGFSRVVYFPYGFLGDNAESQLEGRVALEGAPSIEARHLPCLNESPRLLAVLAQQALEWAGARVDAELVPAAAERHAAAEAIGATP
ncbi:MAG TPA: ferrochelatase [Vicinamibacterales bacterium]|nr:ferrochelatase [Vicinamibacterales bacterium]